MHKLERLAPPGYPIGRERSIFLLGAALAFLYSLFFFSSFNNALDALYQHVGRKRILIPGATMPDFKVLLGSFLSGFYVLAGLSVLLAALHYSYFYQESKSIYLMKRLSNPWELHLRCWTLPILGALCSLLLAFLVLLLYFAIYMIATPEPCLTPDQWLKLWSELL